MYTIYSNIKNTSGLDAGQLKSAEEAIAPHHGYTSFQPFIDAEKKYGINALFILAHADIESAHGNSYFAKTRNNLFGFNAVDSNVYEASTYPSQAASIDFYANFLNKYYLTPGAVYYNGTTPHGVFVKYSSSHDSEAESVVGLMNLLQSHLSSSAPAIPIIHPAPTVTPTGNRYIVKPGDNLWAIANAHGISYARLLQLNSQIKNPNLIYPGQVINISGAPAQTVHIVIEDESLSSIAAHYHTSWQHLAAINHLSHPNLIYPGQKLIIA